MENYLQATEHLYTAAALEPNVGLCCTTNPVWQFPGLIIPEEMLQMNYGCGSVINMADLANEPTILYVGVGGGMELLQFSYFNRRVGGTLGIDVIDEMLEASERNMQLAADQNAWFDPSFITLKKGDALQLPVADSSIDVAGQNCLFNIFKEDDLDRALAEMYRVLKPHGRLVMSDPVSQTPIPAHLQADDQLRALCLSGALPLERYLERIARAGFGTIEVRAKRLYRILDTAHYAIDQPILIDSVEVCAIKDPMPEDGPCIFTGRSAIYHGDQPYFDDGKGHTLVKHQPLAVCDKTAQALQDLQEASIYISPPTYHYTGGGCC